MAHATADGHNGRVALIEWAYGADHPYRREPLRQSGRQFVEWLGEYDLLEEAVVLDVVSTYEEREQRNRYDPDEEIGEGEPQAQAPHDETKCRLDCAVREEASGCGRDDPGEDAERAQAVGVAAVDHDEDDRNREGHEPLLRRFAESH